MMFRKVVFIAGLIFILCAIPASATCTGSGTTWSCSAGSSSSDIQNAINSASDGFTITFAAGSYTLSSWVKFSNNAGGTLICATSPQSVGGASSNSCKISYSSGPVFGGDGFGGNNTKFYRISGFTFDAGGGSPGTGVIWMDNAAACASGENCPVTMYGPNGVGGIRIDHNTFQDQAAGSVAVFFGHNSPSGASVPVGHYAGVIDHNSVNTSDAIFFVQYIGYPDPNPPPNQLGTFNNIFLENNDISAGSMSNASAAACSDGWGGAAYVARYNTSKNCLWAAHGATHAGGPANYEFYNNTVTLDSNATGEGTIDCYRCWHHQGSGTSMVFNNTFNAPQGYNAEIISMANYRGYASGPSIDAGVAACSGSLLNLVYALLTVADGNRPGNYGYPCWHQPGRDFSGKYAPIYVWNNKTGSGGQVNLVNPDFGGVVPNGILPPTNCSITSSGNCDYNSFQMKANREWYNAVSASAQTSSSAPFNGSTGMGFGTLANRPSTCTTNATEAGAGVGYFATDQGPQGTLYTCSATNTWKVWYTPYTYPHPLIQGVAQGPTPPAPINLQGVVN